VILYADTVTDSMRRAIDETNRRRHLQEQFNREHGITPQTVKKAIQESLIEICDSDYVTIPVAAEGEEEYRTAEDLSRAVARLRREMRDAAKDLEFERAAELRDRLQHLEAREIELRTGVRVS
jgi:excinuclease ABC subunit B